MFVIVNARPETILSVMMRTAIISIGLMACSLFLNAAEEPTVDSILERYVKEIGGKEAVSKTKTVLGEGEIEIGGSSGEAKTFRKAPNKTGFRIEVDGNV